jgi:DNA (cytosine-5)-methyltransferase 1
MRPPIFRANFEGELVVDSFCGGGGVSTGIESALGRPVDIAVNHSPAAIAMHKANHPDTKHFCENIWEVDPREACGGRPVGLAWFSPDCTHFSKAKGRKPRSKKIRGLADVVIRWARDVRPRVIMLENVEEFETWGPLGADNQPIPERAGEDFRAWIGKLSDLGYTIDKRTLVAADYGTPTTRKRLFIVARLDGRSGIWPEPTHGQDRSAPWRTAAEIINWDHPVPSIFDRKKPLVEKTLRRIAFGIQKYVFDTADPFIIPVTHAGGFNRSHGVQLPLPTVTGANRGEFALVSPTVVKYNGKSHSCDIANPLHTVVSKDRFALVAPTLIKYHGGERFERAARMNEPIRTVDTQNRFALVAAFLTRYLGQSVGQSVNQPAPTVMPGGQGKTALTCAHLVKYYGTAKACDLNDPLHTVTGQGGKFGLVAVHGEDYQIGDIGMRMLQPDELFAAQGFPDNYKIKPWFKGKPMTKTDQIKMAGNAVCPQVAEALVCQNAG